MRRRPPIDGQPSARTSPWSGEGGAAADSPTVMAVACKQQHVNPPDPTPPQVSRISQSLYDEVDTHKEFDSVQHTNAYSAADTLEVCDML